MNGHEGLAARFEAHRDHLRGVAYRMLGALDEADDAVQLAWLRADRADVGGIENLAGWLTTVVARVCLDMLRTRRTRGEVPLSAVMADTVTERRDGTEPEWLLPRPRRGEVPLSAPYRPPTTSRDAALATISLRGR